jgi:hypothetical protein
VEGEQRTTKRQALSTRVAESTEDHTVWSKVAQTPLGISSKQASPIQGMRLELHMAVSADAVCQLRHDGARRTVFVYGILPRQQCGITFDERQQISQIADYVAP